MNSFPQNIKFQKTWRTYQERVLSELEEHLDDNKLHIIAPPGSGKTVLGLEVLRRLNKPTLILSPTITIKNQWVDRFVDLFMPEGEAAPSFLSTDIKKPGFLTVATYQALHSACTGAEESEEYEKEEDEDEERNGENNHLNNNKNHKAADNKIEVLELLKKRNIKTIVVDEAHHLRNEWWKSLTELTESLDNPTIVALTATPPYDVTPLEWEKYKTLCGPVDAEISIPELVLKEDLCPHQDYVYLSYPSDEESSRINKFRESVNAFSKDIINNARFIESVKNHPWIINLNEHMEDILSNPEYISSISIFLNAVKCDISKKLLNILGTLREKIPPLNLEWLEVLLSYCLFEDIENYKNYEEAINEIKTYLSRIGAIERRKVNLVNSEKINKILATSVTKLNSIEKIVINESGSMNAGMRMVILTDYIRKTEMPKDTDDIKPLNRIGVVPIFELIRRLYFQNIKLGILSGSLIVIPKSARQRFIDICQESEVSENEINFSELNHDKNYLRVEIEGAEKQKIVSLITKLFSEGGITALVGTKSLLGEGWDAPSINCLILASFVGSYMLSNQMRGRAIRILPSDAGKTSNIWHLVCVELNSPDCGQDMETLRRRFKAFPGISFKEPVIENGIDRLNIGQPPYSKDAVSTINETMTEKALNKDGLKKKWQDSLYAGKDGARLVEELKIPKENVSRSFVFSNTITALFWQGITWGGAFFFNMLSNTNMNFRTTREFLIFISIIFGISAIIALPSFLKALWLFVRCGPVEASIRQIAEALLRTLCYTENIKTNIYKLRVKTDKDKYGNINCRLDGGTSFERSIYLDCLHEILEDIENPRYIIIRKSPLAFFTRADYHAVPEAIGKKKAWAEYFEKMWKKYAGFAELVYTRTLEGRKMLLKARTRAISYVFLKKSERISCWK